ncbi:hypothetical protein V6N12_062842 [Hibiscus sabdariffa]|uniref:Carbohydrate kinase PfkB domain-containing protein n=1 Tax=Hibiscus sabdariffa TaxID=183260 RepID=A0ABR2FA23_9ROSI
MKVVNHEGKGRILWAMNGCNYKVAIGGSLSNSLMTLARLSDISIGGHALSVAMAGSVGSDSLTGFYRAELHQKNVNFHSQFFKDGTTETKRVLTTLDARCTMLIYQGTSASNCDSSLVGMVSKINIIVVEGYLFELLYRIKPILRLCEEAGGTSALIAVTTSNVSYKEEFY